MYAPGEYVVCKKWDATYISKLIASGGIDKVIEYYKGRYFGDNRDPQDAFRIAELYVKKKSMPPQWNGMIRKVS